MELVKAFSKLVYLIIAGILAVVALLVCSITGVKSR